MRLPFCKMLIVHWSVCARSMILHLRLYPFSRAHSIFFIGPILLLLSHTAFILVDNEGKTEANGIANESTEPAISKMKEKKNIHTTRRMNRRKRTGETFQLFYIRKDSVSRRRAAAISCKTLPSPSSSWRSICGAQGNRCDGLRFIALPFHFGEFSAGFHSTHSAHCATSDTI